MKSASGRNLDGGAIREWARAHVSLCLAVLIVLACALRVVLAVESPRPWGYVWDRYDAPIRLLYERQGVLPESKDCFMCYHPPLYFYASLPFYRAGVRLSSERQLGLDPNAPFRAVAFLSMLCAAAVVFYSDRLLRLYGFAGDVRVVGFALAAVFPCLFISSWSVEADILVTAFLSAFLFEIARYFTAPEGSARWRVALPAIFAGLSIGTKYSGCVAVPVGVVLIALRGLHARALRPLVRDLAVFVLVAAAIGGWKYADNFGKYGTPLFSNGSSLPGFSIEKVYHWEVYDFASFRLGQLIALMGPDSPEGRLTRLPPYESVWTTLHGLSWSDMSFFSHGAGRHGTDGAGRTMYPHREIPQWMPASVLSLAVLPNLLALIGLTTTLLRRPVWPIHVLVALSMGVYIQWVAAQTAWALKTKYILFLLPAYLLYAGFGLQWLERWAPAPVVKAVWFALGALVVLTNLYMFRFALGR
ncbi:MAG: hypothetical protein ACE5FL_11980 [Myxococcota bacterium]